MIRNIVGSAMLGALVGCASSMGCASSIQSERNADPERAASELAASERAATNEWSGLVDCDYRASHGWGHVYRCGVQDVRNGTPSSMELSLNVAVSDDWLPDNEQAPIRRVLMRFRESERPYGPPSGYRDAETSKYYVLLSATPE